MKDEVTAVPLNQMSATIKLIPPSEIKIYSVNESQLNELAKNTEADIFLNFGISCFSTFFSFVVSLFTTTCSLKVYITFICISIITFISGCVLLCLWWKKRKNRKNIIKEIRLNETE